MLKLSTKEDVQSILTIIYDAQKQMEELSIPQWQDGYPNEIVIQRDMQEKSSFVYTVEGRIAATTVISFVDDPNYAVIEDGEWITDGKYAVVHRIAVANQFKKQGIAKKLFSDIIEYVKSKNVTSIRIDTHEMNQPMLRLITVTGFSYCGVIHVEDGSPRKAFELVL